MMFNPSTLREKSCKSLRLRTVPSHHVHMYCVGKAEERRHWLRISDLKIDARLRACKCDILNFEF